MCPSQGRSNIFSISILAKGQGCHNVKIDGAMSIYINSISRYHRIDTVSFQFEVLLDGFATVVFLMQIVPESYSNVM